MEPAVYKVKDEAEMMALGAELWPLLTPGSIVLLTGELGAGKTTLVRGLLRAAGWDQSVRSPTFNLMQVYDLAPPVLHADLYRLKNASGLDLEDYFETHICLIEWPDRLGNIIDGYEVKRIQIDFTEDGRSVSVG